MLDAIFKPRADTAKEDKYEKPVDPVLQGKRLQSERERQQVQDALDANNDIIR